MSREQDISDIDALYPIDSEFEKTNEVGKGLLVEAILEFGWRNLPNELLEIYADYCRMSDR
jgi:hypothetical protein